MTGTRAWSLSSRIAAALAISSWVQALQMLYLSPLGDGVGWAFFTSHGLVVVGIQVALAITLASWNDGRAWAAAAFCLPVASAAGPVIGEMIGVQSLLPAVGAALLACLGWGHWSRIKAAPIATGVIGGLLGAQIAWFRNSVYVGRNTPIDDLILTGGVGGALAVLALLAGRIPASWARPRTLPSIGLAIVGATLAIVAGPLRARPPSYEPNATLPPMHTERAPIVLIVLDTVGAAHLATFGYERDTMPRLEAFAAQHGLITARSIVNSPWTLPSHASMFTGLYPPRHGAHFPGSEAASARYGIPLREQSATLAELLAAAGYWTVGISANFGIVTPAYGLDQGFHVFRFRANSVAEMTRYTPWHPQSTYCSKIAAVNTLPPFSDGDYFGAVPYRRAHEITDEAIGAIDRAGNAPFFLFLNYMDAHGPYSPPRNFKETFPISDPRLCIPAPTKQHASDPAAVEQLRSLYDSELRYLDQELDRLLTYLASHSRWRDMLVVITSDHGEAFGEHGDIGHGLTLYREELEVPLFIKVSRLARREGQPIEARAGLVQSVDIFPTILEHAQIPLAREIDGRAWGRGRDEAFAWLYARGPKHLVPKRFDDLSSIQHNDWKLIRSSNGRFELFDLQRDPAETISWAGQAIERETRLRNTLQTVEAEMVEPPADTRAAPSPSKAELEALRALNYIKFE